MRAELLKNTLKDLFSSKRAVMVESEPGGGKTEIVGQVANELGVNFIHKHIPTMLVEDFGIPFPTGDALTYKVQSWFPRDPNWEGILLFDDFKQTGNDLQKVVANIIQARELHGLYLPRGCQVVMTGNRTQDRAGSHKMLTHLSNRYTRLELDTHIDDWTKYAIARRPIAVKPEVISFARFRPNLLHDFDPQRESNPTPRAWVEGVSDLLGTVPPEAEYEVFRGAVGDGAASEFMAMLKTHRRLPDPQSIIDNPMTAKVADGEDKNMINYALAGALSHRANRENFGNIIKYTNRLPDEFSVLTVTLAMRKDVTLSETQAFTDWSVTVGNAVLF